MNRLIYILISMVLLITSHPGASRHALLIGANRGGDGLTPLRYAEKDAREFAAILKTLGGFAPSRVKVLLSPEPNEIRQKMDELSNELKHNSDGESLVLVYYSGHADPDHLRLGDKKLSLKEIQSSLEQLPAKIRIGVFDACRSGSLIRFKGGTVSEPFFLETGKNITGQVIIASASEDEQAQESDRLQGSVFSHHWMNGLRGSADITGDTKVTLGEAYNYAYSKTLETTIRSQAGTQHPSYQFRIFGKGDIVLTDLSAGKSGLRFSPGGSGRFLIFSRDYSRIHADFYKEPKEMRHISLAPDEYIILRTHAGKWQSARVRVDDSESDFDMARLQEQPSVINQIKGSVKGSYRIDEEPYDDGLNPDGSSLVGLGLKMGESAGLIGWAFSWNMDRDWQLQIGQGYPQSSGLNKNDSLSFTAKVKTNSYFVLLKAYRKFLYIGTGISAKTRRLEITESEVTTTSPESISLGFPVHVGLELGSRNGFYTGISLGYRFAVWNDHEFLKVESANGVVTGFGPGSGLSLGISLGYCFL